ncbi:secreted protein [Cutibacterium acnes JCM 18909]|nr:secreted protein [Cutibacterium acnes JCM 18909]
MTRSLPPEWDDDRRPGGGGNPQGNIAPTDWKVIIVAAVRGRPGVVCAEYL